MAAPIERLDVPLPVVEARVKLRALQTNPPAGHGPTEQPHDWYEAAFDALIAAQTDQPGGTS
ncbi:hypothetical protein [Streptomyces sp. NBC_01716]|uniref:hypothetical protein n=1 Tax=Streptomyces sp. NBC_01716 TaxID=2975917 RepID=UPI002E331940|nr:hypothetical protein [Streptomyces sp. NBC_01716]